MNTRVRLNTTDTLLDGNFRITTASRILPEPAPATSPGEFGIRRVGNPGPMPKPEDISKKCAGYDDAAQRGLLTAAEAAQLKAQARRYSSGSSEVITNAAGISTVQWSTPDGGTVEEISALSQSDVDDLERLYGSGALTQDKLLEIREANKGQPRAARTGMAATDRALRASADISVQRRIGEDMNKAASDFWGKRA